MNNFRNKSALSDLKRRFKSITQRILLLETELIYDQENIYGIDCKIVGSTNKVYNIQVWKENTDGKINCSCSCLDFTMRKIYCKHIYWLGFMKFNIIEPSEWTVEIYNNFLHESFINRKTYRKNENCPICLENIDYDNEMTINCINTCLNSVHAECWTRNVTITSNTNCVICRTEIL
jgi:hypothetical protein